MDKLEFFTRTVRSFGKRQPAFQIHAEFLLLRIVCGIELNETNKKFAGLILFGYTMHEDPIVFLEAEVVARELGCIDQLVEWAILYKKDKEDFLMKNKTPPEGGV